MAKPFYSIEEVCEVLGKSEDEVRDLVREGNLREFRDSGKIFFKADDVHKLGGAPAGAGTGDDDIMLEPVDEAAAAPEEPEVPAIPTSEGSSILGLEPIDIADAEPPPPPPPAEGEQDNVISAAGIGVFDDDELEIDADPMAKTQITAGPVGDQVALEGSGSGSGLLDLTRKADDTSLGAELLDEIYPGEEESAEPEAGQEAPEEEQAEEEEAEEEAAEPVAFEVAPGAYAVAADPSEGLFSGLLVGSVILLIVGGSVVAGVFQGFMPDYAQFLTSNFWFFLGGATAVPLLSLLIGWIVGKAGAARR